MITRALRPANGPSPRPAATNVDVHALWNLVPDALLAVERSGRILAVNDAASRIFGADHHELVGRPIEALIDESARARHVEMRRRWTESRSPRLMGERVVPARTLDGRHIDVQITLNPVDIGDEVVTIAVIRDVTRNTAELRAQAIARDELVQRLFGLGMSLRSVVPTVEEVETVRRIEAVVEGMGEVVDSLDADPSGRHGPAGGDDG